METDPEKPDTEAALKDKSSKKPGDSQNARGLTRGYFTNVLFCPRGWWAVSVR